MVRVRSGGIYPVTSGTSVEELVMAAEGSNGCGCTCAIAGEAELSACSWSGVPLASSVVRDEADEEANRILPVPQSSLRGVAMIVEAMDWKGGENESGVGRTSPTGGELKKEFDDVGSTTAVRLTSNDAITGTLVELVAASVG